MNKIFEKIKANSKIILAISGGADSIYLLHKCLQLKQKPQLIIAHVNHNLRPVTAKLDENFVSKIAKKFQLPLEKKSINLKALKGNIEANGRKARYEFFEEVRKKYQADWILTAHHLNDQVETILLNFTRGIQTSGIRGIAEIQEKKKILRPLLGITKEQIIAYLKEHQIKFRNDPSNKNIKLSRNFIRHEILPLFCKLNPNFFKTFIHSIEHLQKASDFTEKTAIKWLKTHQKFNSKKEITFQLTEFLENPEIVKENILSLLFKEKNTQSITNHQLQEILKTLQAQKSNRWKEFGRSAKLIIKKNPSTHKREVVITTQIQ